MQVIHKSIEWAYSNPQAIEIFARNMKVSTAIAKQAVDEFYPKSAMQIGEIRDLERSLKDALDYKFIASPKTPQDIAGLFDIVYKPDGRSPEPSRWLENEIEANIPAANLSFPPRVTYPQRLHSIASASLFRLGGPR